MSKLIWIAALALAVGVVPRSLGNAQDNSKNPAATDLGKTVLQMQMQMPEVAFSTPSVKDGRKVYSLDVKADWTCVARSNASESRRGTSNYPTLVTVTCVKADPPAAK